jgi:hypothetical protein
MRLEDPSTTPELWEGPLPVPRPQTLKKQTPIEDITEDVFIKPRTQNPEPEAYPDDLYMEEEILEPENHDNEPMDTGKDPDLPEPPQLIAAPTPLTQKTTQSKTTEHAPSGGGYFPQTTTRKTCCHRRCSESLDCSDCCVKSSTIELKLQEVFLRPYADAWKTVSATGSREGKQWIGRITRDSTCRPWASREAPIYCYKGGGV